MSTSENRPAILLLLGMSLTASPAFSADPVLAPAAVDSGSSSVVAGPVAADSEKNQPPARAAEETNSSGAAGLRAPLAFIGGESAIGANQQAVTAPYEFAGSVMAGAAVSGQANILTSPSRGQPIGFANGLALYPSVLVGFGHNDNVLGTASNRVSSTLWLLQPGVVAEFKHGVDRYTVSYAGNYAHYDNSSADDYNHHQFWAAGDNYFSPRTRLGWGVGYLEMTDARGATDRAVSTEPDRWHAPVARLLGIYGAPGGAERVELESSWMQKRYENNRLNTSSSDVDLTSVAGRFYYRIMPKTSLGFEASNTWANYVLAGSGLDNTDLRVYAGLTWEATAKTSAAIKLGRAYKTFTDASRADASMNSWEASLHWSPRVYSTFDLVSARVPVDATGVGSFIVNTSTALSWVHRWATYFGSRLSVGVVDSKYADSSRKDITRNYGVGIFTDLGYRTRLALDWSNTERNSNQDAFDLKRNILMATLELTL